MPPTKKRQSAAQRRQAQRVRGVGPSATPPAPAAPSGRRASAGSRDVRRTGPSRSALDQLRRRRVVVLAIAVLLIASLIIGALSLFGPTSSPAVATPAAPIVVPTVQPAAPPVVNPAPTVQGTATP